MLVKFSFLIFEHLVNLHLQVLNEKLCSVNIISPYPHYVKQGGVTELEQFLLSSLVLKLKKRAFGDILENSAHWDNDTLSLADSLLAKLNEFKFMFFINCLADILYQAEKLFDVLQCRQLDMTRNHQKVVEFIHYIQTLRNDEYSHKLVQETMSVINCDDAEPPRKKLSGTQFNCKKIYFDTIDTIIKSLNERFAGIKEYTFVELLNIKKFHDFTEVFSHQHIKSYIQEKYPGIFDTKMLLN